MCEQKPIINRIILHFYPPSMWQEYNKLKLKKVKHEMDGEEDAGCDDVCDFVWWCCVRWCEWLWMLWWGEMNDFKLFVGFVDWLTDRWMNKQTDIGGSRVAFVTEKIQE